MNPPLSVILFAVFAGISFLTYLVLLYVYFALSLSTIGEKLKKDNRILAWIPIANIIFTLGLAGRPWWWIFLLLIPFVNIVITIIIWMDVAKNSNQPGWLGILAIIPIANGILPGYLAYVPQDKKDKPHATPFIILVVSLVFLFLAIGLGVGAVVSGIQYAPSETQDLFLSTSTSKLSSPSSSPCNHPNGDLEYWWWEVSQDVRDCYTELYGEPAFAKSGLSASDCTFPNGNVAEWWETVSQKTRDCYVSMNGQPQFAVEGGDVPYCDYDNDPNCWPPGEFPGKNIDSTDHPNGDIEFW